MARIAVVADSHFCEDSRFEECCRVHDWIAKDVADRGVDVIIHTGDVYDRKSTPTERTTVAGWVQSLADTAPVLVVRGNHDALRDLEVLARLERRHPIIVEERAGVHVLGGVAIAAVAWPRKAELLSRLGNVDQEQGEQAAGEALRALLRGLSVELDAHPGPRVLAMHAMVRGSMTSTGQPLVGCDLELGLEDLALLRAHAYLLGHIHKGQAWEIEGAPCVYPGSPRRTAFGELETKGYVLVDVEFDPVFGVASEVEWKLIETPCAPMVLLKAEWVDEHVCLPGDAVAPADLYGIGDGDVAACAGAEVRLRYMVEADRRDAARGRAAELKHRLMGAGAVSVKLEEEVIPTTRARVPELTQAATLEEKLRLLWSSRAEVITDERAARLTGKLVQLEQEVIHGA